MYFGGHGVAVNYKRRSSGSRKAEQGHAEAQNNMGAMHEEGQGVDVNYKKAVDGTRRREQERKWSE